MLMSLNMINVIAAIDMIFIHIVNVTFIYFIIG